MNSQDEEYKVGNFNELNLNPVNEELQGNKNRQDNEVNINFIVEEDRFLRIIK